MIVSYVRERGFQGEGRDPYLTLNKQYIVVSMYYSPYHNVFKITLGDEDNGEGPGVWEIKFFDIVDGRLPEGWSIKVFENGTVALRPDEFFGDFWERYHDGDEEAEQIFAEVLAKIKAFHGDQFLDID